MSKTPGLQEPQMEFVRSFLQPQQLQRMLIYFSKQRPSDPQAQYGLTDVVVRLINDPLCIIFGQHGVYLFSNYLMVYPYNELDASQVAYITNFLRMHVNNLPACDASAPAAAAAVSPQPQQPHDRATPPAPPAPPPPPVPSMKIDARVTKQMGGGFTVRPVQLTNIHLDALKVISALVRGIMCGSQRHGVTYRQHAVNLQLQRIFTRVVVSRAQIQAINVEIEECVVQQQEQHKGTHKEEQEESSSLGALQHHAQAAMV